MKRLGIAAIGMLVVTGVLDGYRPTGYSWPAGDIVMHLQLGASPPLSDGHASWGSSAEDALAVWNSHMARSRFAVVRNSTVPIASGNGSNSVLFSNTVFGSPFGSSTLAVTRTWFSGAVAVESDVVFNTAFSWDSYRGPRRAAIDFRRVAMHEFGHTLGLTHPDQGGQTVTALMNAFISNLDTVAPDDIAGANFLYGTPTAVEPPSADSVTPASGTGSGQTFTFQYSHPSGASNIATAWVWISPTKANGAWANSCFMYYERATNALNLLNNAGTTYASGALGSGNTLSNGQCSVSLGSSSATANGNALTMTLAIAFTGSFTGAKNIYLDAVGASGLSSGWPDRGDYTVAIPAAVQAVSVSPNGASGANQVFTLVYSDSQGANDLATTWLWLHSGPFTTVPGAFANTCFLYLQRATGTLHLLNNAANGYHSGTLGSSTTLENGQCSVNLSGSGASPGGNNLTVTLAMGFKASFAGAKQIHMDAVSQTGSSSGWPTRGSFTVTTPGLPAVAAVSVTPSSGSGNTQAFAFQFSSTAGAADIATAWVWFTPAFSTSPGAFSNTCFLYYNRATNTLNLLNNAANGYASGTLGSGATIANGQCSVALASSSAPTNGNTLTLNLATTFVSSTFAGAKNVYMDVVSASGQSSGWPDRGDWTVPASQPPGVQAVSVTPNAGSGTSQTFTLLYSDTQGATDLATTWVWFTPTFTTSPGAFINTCFMYYHRASNTLHLLNNTATAYVSGAVGTAGILSNGQCSVNRAASNAVASGSSLSLTLAITFTPATFSGTKNIYMDAVSNSGVSSGWPDRGGWTVQ